MLTTWRGRGKQGSLTLNTESYCETCHTSDSYEDGGSGKEWGQELFHSNSSRELPLWSSPVYMWRPSCSLTDGPYIRTITRCAEGYHSRPGTIFRKSGKFYIELHKLLKLFPTASKTQSLKEACSHSHLCRENCLWNLLSIKLSPVQTASQTQIPVFLPDTKGRVPIPNFIHI